MLLNTYFSQNLTNIFVIFGCIALEGPRPIPIWKVTWSILDTEWANRKAYTSLQDNIHACSGIRTHDPSLQENKARASDLTASAIG